MDTETITALPKLGALWSEQGGHYCGVTVDAAGNQFAVICAPKGIGEFKALAWGGYNSDAAGADNFTDGLANTLALLKDKKAHAAAKACSTFEHGGHTDWYLPSAGELRLAHMHCRDQFDTDDWYWSSTQTGRSSAWIQAFVLGSSFNSLKDYEYRVRAFRRFVL